MSDEDSERRDMDDGRQGWLGSVRNWISSGETVPDANHDQDSKTSGTNQSLPSPDEIRRKRVEKMMAMQSTPPSTQQEPYKVSPHIPINTPLVTTQITMPPPPKHIPISTHQTEIPLQKNTLKKELSPRHHTSVIKSTLPLAKSTLGGLVTPSKLPISIETRIHLVLKKVFRVTLDGSDESMYVSMRDVLGIDISDENQAKISLDNLPEIVAARLSLNMEGSANGVLYLIQCYGRCLEEKKAIESRPQKVDLTPVYKALDEAFTLILNYSASCLIEPGVFGEAEEAPEQFVRALIFDDSGLSGENRAVPTVFLGILLKTLEEQGAFEQVVSQLFSLLTKKLVEVKSSLSNSITEPLSVLRTMSMLCSQHKLAAAVFVKMPEFFVPREGTPEAAPQAMPQRGFLIGRNPAFFYPRSGAAVEKITILGIMLGLGPGIMDPEVVNSFKGASKRDRREIEGLTSPLRAQLEVIQSTAFEIFSQLLRAGPVSKSALVYWVCEALLLNTGAEASQADRQKTGTDIFLLNLTVVLLKLAMPVISDPKKFEKVDAESLLGPNLARSGLFLQDTTPLVALPGQESSLPEVSVEAGLSAFSDMKSFSTQIFFLAWRAIHLSIIQGHSKHVRLHQNLGHWQRQIGSSSGPNRITAENNFDVLVAMKLSTEVSLLQPELVMDTLTFLLCSTTWLTKLISQNSLTSIDSSEHDQSLDLKSIPKSSLLFYIPEHLVEDILDFIQFLTRFSPRTLSKASVSLEPLIQFVVYLLAHPSLVRSPHLRAKFGDILFHTFLPESEKPEVDNRAQRGALMEEPYTGLLYSDRLAQAHLAPSLLLLYGDVEHTGFYDKLEHRYHIAALLKYLWKSPEHRLTFRRISEDSDQFVRFANGLMNETNALVASVMEKLPEIRSIQLQQKDTTFWSSLAEERQNEIEERLQEAERAVTSNLLLCNETLHMVNYLTSDLQIRKPFLLPELLPRLASMLLSVIGQLVGSKGLEIKVENPEKYNFRPKDMLTSVISVIIHFGSTGEKFDSALATSGFYRSNLLPTVLNTARRLNLLDASGLILMENLCQNVEKAAEKSSELDKELGEIPEEFLCPVMCTIMQEPVYLPTSGTVMDRSTIVQHLLNDETDPFNRKPLNVNMLVPDEKLKARIEAYLANRTS